MLSFMLDQSCIYCYLVSEPHCNAIPIFAKVRSDLNQPLIYMHLSNHAHTEPSRYNFLFYLNIGILVKSIMIIHNFHLDRIKGYPNGSDKVKNSHHM